ncbi:type II secretion system GspH family protein [Luteolibacter flavescens]|uniref:Type II secretion system GspH family protein n=1 Tax=Luteolibacter flavescens TaxID=1859460 RepID=A0ABT3FTG0_9BACT|nr:type II secretion system protein [Luteolibacter flavescens]MCW1886817.1 type II secretion system GspH family protein [Luteolibacter flavescens]
MKKPTFGKRAAGFTLVELMVCVVIVISLAALVFGLTRNAMAKGNLSASMTRVRDLGVRVQAYAQDNAGILPVWKDQSQDLYWWGALIKDPRNPTELDIFRSDAHKQFDNNPSNPNLSYGWNARVMGRSESSEGDDGPKRLANFKDAARALVLADGPARNPNALLDESSLPDPERYDGKAAGLMLDGSAIQLTIENDFKGQSVWFMTEEEREAQGK